VRCPACQKQLIVPQAAPAPVEEVDSSEWELVSPRDAAMPRHAAPVPTPAAPPPLPQVAPLVPPASAPVPPLTTTEPAGAWPAIATNEPSPVALVRARRKGKDGLIATWMLLINLLLMTGAVFFRLLQARIDAASIAIGVGVAILATLGIMLLFFTVGGALLRMSCWGINRLGGSPDAPCVPEPGFLRAVDILAMQNLVYMPISLFTVLAAGIASTMHWSVSAGVLICAPLCVFCFVVNAMLPTNRWWKGVAVVGGYFLGAILLGVPAGLVAWLVL
jgi:hypothetical protein